MEREIPCIVINLVHFTWIHRSAPYYILECETKEQGAYGLFADEIAQ